MKRIVWLLWALLLVLPAQGRAAGNMQNESFAKAKRLLEQEVYYDHRQTLYCGAFFDAHKQVELPQGFTTDKHQKRSARVEWEHVVPAENFGRAFSEWREGHALCWIVRAKLSGDGPARKRSMPTIVACRPICITCILP